MSPRIYVTLLRLTQGDHQLSEDLVQDTFRKAWQDWASVRDRPEDQQAAWLTRVAVNTAIDIFRRNTTAQQTITQLAEQYEPPEPDLTRKALTSIAVQRFIEVVNTMPAQRSRIAFLAWRCGWRPGEIAAALGITPGQVSQQLSAAKSTLRDELGPYLPFEPADVEGGTRMTRQPDSTPDPDDAVLAALYLTAEETHLPGDTVYDIDRGLQQFSEWLADQPQQPDVYAGQQWADTRPSVTSASDTPADPWRSWLATRLVAGVLATAVAVGVAFYVMMPQLSFSMIPASKSTTGSPTQPAHTVYTEYLVTAGDTLTCNEQQAPNSVFMGPEAGPNTWELWAGDTGNFSRFVASLEVRGGGPSYDVVVSVHGSGVWGVAPFMAVLS
jgi:RNA polymerase sigma-70 factor (ECF subfamily)